MSAKLLHRDRVRKKQGEAGPPAPRFVRYTLTRIASELGVSLTTVSRALSGSGRIGEETRRRILDRAEQLQRSAAASSPPLMKRILGLFTPWYSLSHGVRTSIANMGQEAARSVCENYGYGLVVGSFGNAAKPTLGDEMLRSGGLAGLLLHRTRDEAALAREMAGRGIRCVFVYRVLEGQGLNYVGVDFDTAMGLAVDHCRSLGFDRLGIVCGDPAYPSQGGYREAFLKRTRGAGLALEPSWMESVEVTEAEGYEAARRMFSARTYPRAVMCCSDRLAFGVLRALHDAGKRIPSDVAVVTIDGAAPTAYTRPSLTAVQIPWYDMFSLAARFLIEMADGEAPVENIGARLRCELVVRESTAG
jgi:LacI family transcriptional regulator